MKKSYMTLRSNYPVSHLFYAILLAYTVGFACDSGSRHVFATR